jgi:LmbE family N-acetylglucosaminyl deacetylase
MLQFKIGHSETAFRTLLCIGAHCDDIEIGCGGTILRLIQDYPQLHIHWVVFSSNPQRAAEAQNSANTFLKNAGTRTVLVKNYRNGYFPAERTDIKDYFEELKTSIQPDVILTHFRNDLHQDHRTLSELTWNTFRNHLILEYEIPKYDGDLGTPNLYMPLSEDHWRRKISILMECFPSQRDKHWFEPETFAALMRLRGIESNASSGYAEAFYCRKAVLG